MSKTKKVQNEVEDESTLVEEKEELSDDIIVEDDAVEEEGDSGIELSEIPIEEFMKDPEKMAKITDEAESEESTNWCPRCSDHTIFVDRVCTVCGFAKGAKKGEEKEDEEDSTDFEILPDDDIIGDLGYEYEDEESFD